LRLIKILPLLLLLAACAPVTPAATEGSAPPAPGEPATAVVDTAAVEPTVIEATTDTGVVETPAAVGMPLQWTSGGLIFTLESPTDGVIVTTPWVNLEGTTSVETILGVNDEVYVLPGGQPFSIPVPLLEGPNALGIVASDYEGNSIEFVLTVIYQP
jgi:hypothetical protein